MIPEALFLALVVIFLRKGSLFHGNGEIFPGWPFALLALILYGLSLLFALGNQEIGTFFLRFFPLFHCLVLGIFIISALWKRNNLGNLLLALGLLANFLPIFVNGRMPVARSALEKAGQWNMISLLEAKRSLTHMLMEGTKLNFLGDVIPLPYGGKVISVGDLLISIGIFLIIVGYGTGRGKYD